MSATDVDTPINQIDVDTEARLEDAFAAYYRFMAEPEAIGENFDSWNARFRQVSAQIAAAVAARAAARAARRLEQA
jgi:hypothetical protein